MAKKETAYRIPEHDREILIDPVLDSIPQYIEGNRDRMSRCTFKINETPLHVLRNNARWELIRKAISYTVKIRSLIRREPVTICLSEYGGVQINPLSRPRQEGLTGKPIDYNSIKEIPIIQTGHEPVLYYPGLWIKNHLVHYLAKRVRGIGVNLIVDNDACDVGFVYVPVIFPDRAYPAKVVFAEGTHKTAYEEIVFPDIAVLTQFTGQVMDTLDKNNSRGKIRTTMKEIRNAFEEFSNRIMEYHRSGCMDLTGLFTAARSLLEEEFSLNNLELPVSLLCETDAFYQFFLHIAFDAARLAGIYNEKLADYRKSHKIRSKANPLPDLKIDKNAVEVPFWYWRAGGQRRKLFAQSTAESVKIMDGEEVLVTIGKGGDIDKNISDLIKLIRSGIKIRPRAVSMTMFSRLFFSDIFIHGIGGARYDAITDEIISGFYGITPPSFTTVSATLFLPLDVLDIDENTLKTLQRELKDMIYNPERYASEEIQRTVEFREKQREKQQLLELMSHAGKDQKRHYFYRIKELNALMFSQIKAEYERKKKELDEINACLAYNRTIKFREYPIYLYPHHVLKEFFLSAFPGV